jgi:type VI protein secretion system component Hcp
MHMSTDRVTNPATKELSDAELEKATGGSQSSGSGAGKVTFNPFSITRKIDKSSPSLF